ncbi:MAG: alpha/beta fold hydrolase [Spirochaetes bacterium]|nr:alpha/beta fold hydrolase [Spirochaetota bacterium]
MAQLQHIERFVDGMKVVEIPGRPGAPTFLCMHGFGANCYDLAGLSQHLKFPEGTRYLFPDGILRIDLGYGAGYEGRAWFPIDFAEIERIRREGGLRDLSKTLPAGMAEARDKLIDAMAKLECDPAKTVVGGFSQGAMLATEIMLNHKADLAGLVVFSGTLVNRTGWETAIAAKYAAQNKTMRFIQSHGKHDPVLPFQAAERLNELFVQGGGKGDFIAFEGQHEIPLEVVDGTNKWLKEFFA